MNLDLLKKTLEDTKDVSKLNENQLRSEKNVLKEQLDLLNEAIKQQPDDKNLKNHVQPGQ